VTRDAKMPPELPKWSMTVITLKPVASARLARSIQARRSSITGKSVSPNRKPFATGPYYGMLVVESAGSCLRKYSSILT
jgi:hypothetical protein